MILVTGGAGFIGSAMIWKLNTNGYNDILVADELGTGDKWLNIVEHNITEIVHKDELFDFLDKFQCEIKAVFHMGACSSTTEVDGDFLMKNNFRYSIDLFNFCTRFEIPFVYASSAATYGSEEDDFNDNHENIAKLKPINKYGYSKQLFDCWVLKQKQPPPFWAGLKFFNVYGPGESHKGSQASVVFHAFPQIQENRELKLFKSHRPDVKDFEQKRDFVYVKDVVDVMFHMLTHADTCESGIYNLGSGTARTFEALGKAVFNAMDCGKATFKAIDMPDSIRNQYQYFTEASLSNLREKIGYTKPMTSLEDGISDYVQNYLLKGIRAL